MNQLAQLDKIIIKKEFGGMKLRHLYAFNLTMLGKQGWKFTTNQDTIMFKIFNAKYFSSMDFLDVHLGHNPIFVWFSIHASQVMVKQGVIGGLAMVILLMSGLNLGSNNNLNPFVSTTPIMVSLLLKFLTLLIMLIAFEGMIF